MKKIWIIIILSCFLISCKQDKFIEIGVVGSMTGSQSEISIFGRRGVELAVEELNDSGGLLGKEIVLVIKDDNNDEQRSKEVVEEFVDDSIELAIGIFTSKMMVAAYDTIHNNEILYLSPTVSADRFNEIDDQFIRFIASANNQAITLSEVAKNNNHKTFVVIADSSNKAFYDKMYKEFNKDIISDGGYIFSLIEYEELTAYKLEEVTKELNNNSVDGLFIISNASDFATIAQHVASESLEVSYYGTLWSHTNEVIRLGGTNIEGAYIVSGISNNRINDKYKAVSEAYFERYGEKMSFVAMYSYETMMALGRAIDKADSIKWRDVKNQLIDIDSFSGLQVEYDINEYGDCSRAYFISQIIDGGFKTIEEK